MRARACRIGRGIGEPGGLDDHAPERGDTPVVAPAQQILKGCDEVAAHRAAQAPGREQDHAVVGRLDEQVVEPDLAELVDDHDRVGERRVAQEMVEQRRLARAEKTRSARSAGWAGADPAARSAMAQLSRPDR